MIVKKLLFKPNVFFNELKKNLDFKQALVYYILLSFIFYLSWFIYIMITVRYFPYSPDYVTFVNIYRSFSMLFVVGLLLSILTQFFTVLVISLVLSIVGKIILFLLTKKLSYIKIWSVSVYSLTPYIIGQILLNLNNVLENASQNYGLFMLENYFIQNLIVWSLVIYSVVLFVKGILIISANK
jgi:hypothetical protein